MTEFDEKLLYWIESILEDDPLPDEIKFVYFCIVMDKSSFHLEMRGSELKNTKYFEYWPLEAQYFFYDYPKDVNAFKEELILSIKNLPIFEDRKIYLLFAGKLTKLNG